MVTFCQQSTKIHPVDNDGTQKIGQFFRHLQSWMEQMFDTEPENHWTMPLLDLLAAFGVSQLEQFQHLQEAT